MVVKNILNKNIHKKSLNKDINVKIELNNNSNELLMSEGSKKINQYEVFDDERNSCTNYRLTITPNIIASNVLSLPITEVYDSNNNNITGDTRFNLLQSLNTGYTYNFGYDIFDNHFLRLNTFKTGNTITDYNVFTITDMLSIQKSIKNNLIVDNGWVCFQNKTKINNKKMVSWKQPNEKIDLFPTRDYFSLKPFIENNNINNNWDYTITYPYKNEKTHILTNSVNNINGIPIFKAETGFTNEIGNYLEIQTPYKHGLNAGNIIRLKDSIYQTGDTYQILAVGDSLGNNQDTIFRLNIDKYSKLKNTTYLSTIKDRRVVKYVDGIESEYYLRVFKKLEGQHMSNLYKLGFSKNIYSDDIYQIQYIDNINVSGLTDNIGRQISELYFTIIKKNIDSDKNGHNNVFGNITSGIDEIPGVTGYTNVRVLNSNNANELSLEENITISGSSYGNGMFLGDIVEFNKNTVKENILDTVKHRFNLINRETSQTFEYHEFTSSINDNLLSGSQAPYWEHNINVSYMKSTLMTNESENYRRCKPISGQKVTVFGCQYDYFKDNNDYKALYVVSFDVRVQSNNPTATIATYINTDFWDSLAVKYDVQPYTWTRCHTNPFSAPITGDGNGFGYLIINNDSSDGIGKWVDIKNVKIEKVKFNKYVNHLPKTVTSNAYRFANDQFYLEAGKTYTLRVDGNNSNATLGRHLLVELRDNVSMTTTEFSGAFTKSITFVAPLTKSYQINSYYHPYIPDNTTGSVDLGSYYLYEGTVDPGQFIAPTPWVTSLTEVSDKLLVKNTIITQPKNEGYYYEPHHKLQIKNFSNTVKQGEILNITHCEQIPFSSGVTYDGNVLLLTDYPNENYEYLLLNTNTYFSDWDRIRICKINLNNEIYDTVTLFAKKQVGYINTIFIPYDNAFFGDIINVNDNNYLFGKYISPNIPSNSINTTPDKVLWRDIQPEGVFDENSNFTNELIYTNDAFYINKNFNLYLRRQDPFGYYGLRSSKFPSDIFGNEKKSLIENNIYNNPNTIC